MRYRAWPPAAPALAVLFLLPILTARVEAAQTLDAHARHEAMTHYEAGNQAMTTEHFEQAALEFEQAVKLDPLLVLAHYGLGQARMALKDYPAAVRAYASCRKAFHDDVATELQRDSGREQRLDAQIRNLEDQLAIANSGRPTGSLRPLSPVTPANLQQQLDTLRVQQKRGNVGPQPTPPWISVALGGAYFRQGAFSDAEREYKAAVEADPKVGEAHNNLAVVYLLTKRPDDADREIALAEKAGFKVRDGLKQDVQRLRASQRAAP